MLCVTVPCQSNPFKLSIRLTIFWNSYFSEQNSSFSENLFFITATNRSSHQRCSVKKSCSSKFRNINRERPVLESLLDKVGSFQGYNFTKNKTPTQVFSCKYCEIFKNICERLLLCLTEFSEQLVFREAIFQNSLSNIFISNFYFTFVSINTFISLNNFITYRDSHAK